MNFPSFSQWKQIFKVLKKGEKIALLVFFVIATGSLIFLGTNFYVSNTKSVPDFGDTYTEGIVGQPRFINPTYSETNDIDRALVDLVFSGLMTYDKNGQIVKDLASDIKITNDGKTYTFVLKDNIFWHDRKSLTVDDVIFTIKTIQNSDYKSPLRANWIDVGVEKISTQSFSFILKQPYNSFLENCVVKIIPKHIWENISAENFALSLYNLQPVGSGPFEFKNLKQTNTGFIETLNLKSNRKYYNSRPFLSSISFKFFPKIESLIKAYNSKTINGFSLANLDKNKIGTESQTNQGLLKNEEFSVYYFSLPRYFAVFFNNKKPNIFSEANIRKALTYSVNKSELAQKIIGETGANIVTVDSPILPDFFDYKKPTNVYEFDIEKAKQLLDKSGFKDNGQGLREKAITKKPAFQFKNYLKLGSRGAEVTQLQVCLARLDDNFKNLLSGETNENYGKITENTVTEFQKKYLPLQNSTGETGPATRQKLNELCTPLSPNSDPLKFTLVTINQPQLLEVANLLKNYWQNIGVSVEVNAVSITNLKPIIKNRDYDALLYGETLGIKPDLYPFWHSSQKIDPGLNLSQYENKDADKLLKDARQTLDEKQKEQYLEKLQSIIINDAPALFLYSHDYVYWVSQKVQGIDTVKIADPAKRFSNIASWFIQTKRVWE